MFGFANYIETIERHKLKSYSFQSLNYQVFYLAPHELFSFTRRVDEKLPPTMGDIAIKAGVDRSTVSLALRNDPRIRSDTRQRIQQIATELGFRQNPAVAHLMALLRQGRRVHYQANLAVLYLGTSKAQGLPWLEGAKDRASHLGYGLEVFRVRELGFPAPRLEQMLLQRGVEGILVAGLLGTPCLPEEYLKLLDSFSCVCVAPHQDKFHCVTDDNYATAFDAVLAVRQFGYDSIAMVGHAEVEEQIGHRFEAGYQMALKYGASLKSPPVLILQPEDRDSFLKWFHQHQPKVILSTLDILRDWLEHEGLRVPHDVGLVHLDQSQSQEKNWAGMRQNWRLKGEMAVNLVVNQVLRNEKGSCEFPSCLLTPSMWIDGETIRQQCKPRKKSEHRKSRTLHTK